MIKSDAFSGKNISWIRFYHFNFEIILKLDYPHFLISSVVSVVFNMCFHLFGRLGRGALHKVIFFYAIEFSFCWENRRCCSGKITSTADERRLPSVFFGFFLQSESFSSHLSGRFCVLLILKIIPFS